MLKYQKRPVTHILFGSLRDTQILIQDVVNFYIYLPPVIQRSQQSGAQKKRAEARFKVDAGVVIRT